MKENHRHQLSIFEPPPTDTAIQVREWMEFKPITQLGGDAAIEFHVVPQSSGYLDLKQSKLYVKLKVTKGDGTSMAETDIVGLVNLPLLGFYRYKAYIDTLLTTKKNDTVWNEAQMFTKDTAGKFDETDAKNGANTGLFKWIWKVPLCLISFCKTNQF
ncbi:hypothetical protein FSP39_013024 [Pinctada imbricata]|uniref:Uncharacterized protein n=1 Tax=Pinctada imbricata TaxID=66713 RepID=A0AA88YSX3_PINIB|nr:hypothetical protein FSP39_013024 [Pinctada imbricata]